MSSAEIVLTDPTDMRRAVIGEAISRIFSNGHAIHGYSSAGGNRVMMVYPTPHYTDHEPLLGFGMDRTAERALARALFTYGKRVEVGLDVITEKMMPESLGDGPIESGARSRLDRIVWGADFCLHQNPGSGLYIASSNYGGGPSGMASLEVEGNSPFEAVELLTSAYDNGRLTGPVMSLAG
jgi:hypothetical protein